MKANSREQLQAPAVTVVVPCRNENRHVGPCLRSILAQQEPPGGFEVVVADGMSTDGTREILQQIAQEDCRLRVVDNPARVTPCALNRGIQAARGTFVAILGSHNRYAPDYLVRCLEVAQATGADNVGGAMFSEGNGLIQKAIAAAHHSPFSVGGARWHNPAYSGPADTVFGGFYKRELFERIGFFDEELVRNQDDELNLRLTRSGGTIWQSATIKSWYSPRNSLRALFKQYKQYGYWKVRVIQKHKLPASWRHLVPGAFVLIMGLLGLSIAACLPVRHLLPGAATLASLSAGALLFLTASYVTALIAASILTARKHGLRLFPVLLLVFPCYHFGYGYGWLRGAWDFLLRKRGPANEFVTMTRAETRPVIKATRPEPG